MKSRFRQALRRGLSVVLPRRVFMTHGPADSRAVCLTFDDGPDPELTPRILDLLAEKRVPGTFFVIGRQAEKYPDIVRRMIAEGHVVGNHSYSHPSRTTLSVSQVAAEVVRASEIIASIVGEPPRHYRPPNGKLTARDLLKFWRLGLSTVLWNVDPKDYNKTTADEVLAHFDNRPPEAGDLILFHDNHPHAISILPELIATSRKRGLEFKSVDAWTTRSAV
jgi:peptidoglycan/xylan/chitin deacetylase (PgdA/CDA1 family)